MPSWGCFQTPPTPFLLFHSTLRRTFIWLPRRPKSLSSEVLAVEPWSMVSPHPRPLGSPYWGLSVGAVSHRAPGQPGSSGSGPGSQGSRLDGPGPGDSATVDHCALAWLAKKVACVCSPSLLRGFPEAEAVPGHPVLWQPGTLRPWWTKT